MNEELSPQGPRVYRLTGVQKVAGVGAALVAAVALLLSGVPQSLASASSPSQEKVVAQCTPVSYAVMPWKPYRASDRKAQKAGANYSIAVAVDVCWAKTHYPVKAKDTKMEAALMAQARADLKGPSKVWTVVPRHGSSSLLLIHSNRSVGALKAEVERLTGLPEYGAWASQTLEPSTRPAA